MKNKESRLKSLSTFKKKKTVLFLLAVFSLYFVGYQFMFMFVLERFQSSSQEKNFLEVKDEYKTGPNARNNETAPIRGVRFMDISKYKPDDDGMFTCFDGLVKIPYSQVNDDYCDCPGDGSDEPGTNACANGTFCCATQTRHTTGRGPAQCIPSYKVNDGICDCCDGSDEWNSSVIIETLSIELQMKLKKFLAPCLNRC